MTMPVTRHTANRDELTFRFYVTNGPNVPPSRAGISHAVVVGNSCYIGGQLATDMLGRFRADTTEGEALTSILNFFAVLMAAGFSVRDTVFLGLSLADLDDLPVVSAVYNRFFQEHERPARTVEQASRLPYGARFRVNGVAIRERRCQPAPCHCRRQRS